MGRLQEGAEESFVVLSEEGSRGQGGGGGDGKEKSSRYFKLLTGFSYQEHMRRLTSIQVSSTNNWADRVPFLHRGMLDKGAGLAEEA